MNVDVEVQVGTAPLVDVDVAIEPPTFTVVSVLPTGPRGPEGPAGPSGDAGSAKVWDGAEYVDGSAYFGPEDPLLTDPTLEAAFWFDTDDPGGTGIESVVAGSNIDVDVTDPANPVISVETLVDADIPASIARDSEVAAAVSASEAGQVRDGDAAGGVLSGTYPNPGFAADMATQAELDGLSTVYQPLDADLTALAALTTTAYGRAFLELANAAAGRTALALGSAATANTGDFDAAGAAAAAQAASQPVDSDLTAIAALSTTAFGRGLLALADAAALRSSAGLVLGTDIYSKSAVDSGFQPLDADLTDLAAIADAQGDIIIRGASGWERLAKSATSTDVLTAGASQPAWAAASGGGGSFATHVLYGG